MDRARLSLRVDEWEGTDWPAVTILIDGSDLSRVVGGDSFVGFDPDDILGADEPLIPDVLPRRVAVYRCQCGEPGCGCLAPQIRREGDDIVWSDARDYTGVFARPLLTGEVPPGGTRLRMPVLRFDAGQYEEEVRRASKDRSWETDRRATARILRSTLTDAETLRRAGYTVQWAAPTRERAESFSVSLLDRGRVQVVVEANAPVQQPREWAAELAALLLAVEPEKWNVTFRGNFAWPAGK